jgi:hypothetical protein
MHWSSNLANATVLKVLRLLCFLCIAANLMDTSGEVPYEKDIKSGMLQSWNKFCFTGGGRTCKHGENM